MPREFYPRAAVRFRCMYQCKSCWPPAPVSYHGGGGGCAPDSRLRLIHGNFFILSQYRKTPPTRDLSETSTASSPCILGKPLLSSSTIGGDRHTFAPIRARWALYAYLQDNRPTQKISLEVFFASALTRATLPTHVNIQQGSWLPRRV